MQGNTVQALEWYNVLVSVVPTDPGILAKLGDMFDKEGDKTQAFQYYSESYRYNPSSLPVLAYLGSYYVQTSLYEPALQFFHLLASIQPSEVKWRLMIASCHRRSGNYQAALETYKGVNERWPENVECLRFLVRIMGDLGERGVGEYMAKLAKLEKGIVGGGEGEGRNSSVTRQQKVEEVERVDPNLERKRPVTAVRCFEE